MASLFAQVEWNEKNITIFDYYIICFEIQSNSFFDKTADAVKDLVKTVGHLNAEDLIVYIDAIESNLDLRNSYIQEFK